MSDPKQAPVKENGVSPKSLMHNNQYLQRCWTAFSFLTGTVAGILGLQALYGAAFYILSGLAFSALIVLLGTGMQVDKYFQSPTSIAMGMFDHISGYILSWTLFYAFVYVY